MTAQFEIAQLGHPVLRQKAQAVDNITDDAFQGQLDALLDFVLARSGMGIAAPQVGISQQFFILSSHPNQRYPYAPDIAPFVVINPSITWLSDTLIKDWEGCLSLPGIRALVPRHDAIKVSYQTRQGDVVEMELNGFLSRVFQHEYDHLHGRVFLDRIESTQDVMMEQEWQRQIIANPQA